MSSSLYGGKGPTGRMQKMGNATGTGDIVPKGYSKGQLSQYTPEQKELFSQLFSHVGPESYLSRLAGGDEDMFNEMEAPAMRQFNELQGGLASRFSQGGGAGSLSARRSSGFQNTNTAAASNFAQDLASKRQGLQQQAIKDLMGISESLLGQRPEEKFLVEKQQKQPSFWEQLALSSAGGASKGLTSWATGGF